jgi:hypothetical protein
MGTKRLQGATPFGEHPGQEQKYAHLFCTPTPPSQHPKRGDATERGARHPDGIRGARRDVCVPRLLNESIRASISSETVGNSGNPTRVLRMVVKARSRRGWMCSAGELALDVLGQSKNKRAARTVSGVLPRRTIGLRSIRIASNVLNASRRDESGRGSCWSHVMCSASSRLRATKTVQTCHAYVCALISRVSLVPRPSHRAHG